MGPQLVSIVIFTHLSVLEIDSVETTDVHLQGADTHRDSKSHMRTSSTMMDYLDFLAVQIRAKRMSLQLTAP